MNSGYRYSPQVRSTLQNNRLQKRVMLALIALMTVAIIILGIYGGNAIRFREQARAQYTQRMINATSAAIDQVNRITNSVQSNTAARLGQVRQYVYHMDQMNQMSLSLYGETDGRLAPEEAFTALYADLDTFDTLLQTSTSSILETRTLLLTHLLALQSILTQ